MNEKPEALRLADYIDQPLNNPNDVADAVSAELRRQHAEIERLHQINQSHEMKLSVRGYEIQIADLEAQRDALLEALEEIHQATMKNKVVIAKYIGINFLAAIAIRKAKEGK